jgi:hypothetical protein
MIFGISKTTINGVLAFLIATFTSILGFQIPSAMLSPGANHIWLYVTLACNFAVALMRVWVGLLQNDTPPPPPPDPPAVQKTDVLNKVIPMFLLFAVASLLAGCPASQSQLQKAATASQQAMIVVQGFQQGEILAYNQGKTCLASGAQGCIVISDADHLFIEQSVSTIAQLDKTTNGCIGSAGTPAAAVTCASSAITTISQLQADGDLHIKSAQAKQDFDLAMIGAKGALSVISTILGGN